MHDILQANQAAAEKKDLAVASVPAVTTAPSAVPAQACTQSNLMQRRQQRREQRRRRQQQHTHGDKENMPELATNIMPGPATNAPPELLTDKLPEPATNVAPVPAKDMLPGPVTKFLPGPATNVPPVPAADISIIVNDKVCTNFNKVADLETAVPGEAAPRGEISANDNNKGSTSSESAASINAKSTPGKQTLNPALTQQKAPPAQDLTDAGTRSVFACV